MALIVILLAAFAGYVVFETHTDFTRLRSLVGIVSILAFGFIFSGKL